MIATYPFQQVRIVWYKKATIAGASNFAGESEKIPDHLNYQSLYAYRYYPGTNNNGTSMKDAA